MEALRNTFNWSDGCVWDACGSPPEEIFSVETLGWWFTSAVRLVCNAKGFVVLQEG